MRAWLVAVISCACGGSAPAPAPPIVVEHASGPVVPVTIAVPVSTPPSWLEPPLPDAIDDPFGARDLVALGTRSAVVRTAAGWFGVHLEQGASGPLAVPADPTWIGVGGDDDQVLVALADGSLYAAASTVTAASGFERIGQVKDAAIWAASHHLIVAAVGERVHWSRTGAKFRSQRVARGFAATAVFARVDGVMVVIGAMPGEAQPVTFVSKTGAVWRRSAFQPAAIVQRGAEIRTTVDDCTRAVMAWGSTDWVKAEPAEAPPLWLLLVHRDIPRAWPDDAPFATSMFPTPPPYDAARAVTAPSSPCDVFEPGEDSLDARRFRVGTHLDLVAGRPGDTTPTHTALDLLDDATPTRSAHALAFDRATGAARVIDPPAGCLARYAHAERGLAVLVCDDHVLTLADGAWIDEGTITAAPHGLAVADDGSAALYTDAGVALRSQGTWRFVDVPGASVIRVVPGGDVLALVIERESPLRVSLVRASLTSPPTVLAAGIVISAPVTSFEIVDGVAQVAFRRAAPLTIYTDGSLR